MCNAELESFNGISSDDCSLHLRITVIVTVHLKTAVNSLLYKYSNHSLQCSCLALSCARFLETKISQMSNMRHRQIT